MSNYIEYDDKIVFHPGYYIKEIVEESGLTQADFARKLDTTPKNLSVLINGEQSLSIDIAMKLSRMFGTSVKYWLNLQQTYDSLKAECVSGELYKEEEIVFKVMDYDFYIEKYNLPSLKRKEDQIKRLREYLKIASLTVLKEEELTTSFRGFTEHLSESEIINSNAFVQIAMNEAIKKSTPKYNKKKFETILENMDQKTIKSVDEVEKIFQTAGVRFMLLPCLKSSKIDAVSKKINGSVFLVINDKRNQENEFSRILLKESKHIVNNEYGVSFNGNNNEIEIVANEYARQMIRNKLSVVTG